jgi:hypothetical protein
VHRLVVQRHDGAAARRCIGTRDDEWLLRHSCALTADAQGRARVDRTLRIEYLALHGGPARNRGAHPAGRPGSCEGVLRRSAGLPDQGAIDNPGRPLILGVWVFDDKGSCRHHVLRPDHTSSFSGQSSLTLLIGGRKLPAEKAQDIRRGNPLSPHHPSPGSPPCDRFARFRSRVHARAHLDNSFRENELRKE